MQKNEIVNILLQDTFQRRYKRGPLN